VARWNDFYFDAYRQETARRNILVAIDDPHLNAAAGYEMRTGEDVFGLSGAKSRNKRYRETARRLNFAALRTSGAGLSCLGTAARMARTTSAGLLPARRAE
jgi:hypothetical protein